MIYTWNSCSGSALVFIAHVNALRVYLFIFMKPTVSLFFIFIFRRDHRRRRRRRLPPHPSPPLGSRRKRSECRGITLRH